MTTCSTSGCGTGGWAGPLPGDPDNNSILSATSEFGGVQLVWTMPNTNAYAVAHTRIYRSIADQFATAIPLVVVAGNSYFDSVIDDVIRPYYYWIQHVSINGTELTPIGPAWAAPKPAIDQVIAALAGRIESSALAEALRARVDKIAELEYGVTQINTTMANENLILSQELSALRDDLTGAIAYINEQQTINVNDKQALVTAINTQLSQFNTDLYAAIQEEATTRATETGDLFAQKTVKVDLAGNVSGYGLSARVDPTGAATSDFQVRADTFSIAPPSVSQATAPTNPYHGKVWVDTSVMPNVVKWYNSSSGLWQTTPVKGAVPFIVKTAPEVLDGYTVPPGVYIDSAYVTRLQANQVDTRGLTIKDALGNVILSASQNLDASKVSGLGSLATKNSVNWNADLVNIPTFGNFAYLSSITSANISTYIASAAIGNAYISDLNAAKINAGTIHADRLDATTITSKVANLQSAQIGNAQVNTLNIAGNAVTVPVGAKAVDHVYTYDYNTTMDILSCSINAEGAGIIVAFGAEVAGYVWQPSGETYPATLYLKRNGVLLHQVNRIIWANTFTHIYYDTPGPGTHTYTLSMIPSFMGEAHAYTRSLVLLGAKR